MPLNVREEPSAFVAYGQCVGGTAPANLHLFPLLCWNEEDGAFLEDGKATVKDIVAEIALNQTYDSVATKFGTTEEHVRQAIQYASMV